MIGYCKLFDIETDLRLSHIWPRFVIEYVKVSGSQYFRNLSSPNKREQDGLKEYLLSENAEQMFSRREKWFSETIFTPYLSGGITSFNYNHNLYYFGISFLWRGLIMHLDFKPELQKEWYFETLKLVSTEWKEYLKNETIPENFSNLNLMFTDRICSSNIDATGLDFYVTRALDITIITSSDRKYLAVYGKFLRFIFWSIITTDDTSQNHKDTLVLPSEGTIAFPQEINDAYLKEFLINRLKQIQSLPKPSEKQQEVISKERNKVGGEFWETDAGQSILNDLFNLNR